MPLDTTLPEESIFAAFFSGQIGEAVKRANEFDIWLAAHLVDMMQPLGLLIEIEGCGWQNL
jgi:nuclear pore complex protein Nup85